MSYIYVLAPDGKPLMPTTRCGHVRWLLKNKKARVVERVPFTIRLSYDTEEITQDLYMGIDPGRTNIGVSVCRDNGVEVFSAELKTRNKDIPKLIEKRAIYRREHRRYKRRCKRQRRAKLCNTAVHGGVIKRHLPGYKKPVECKVIRNKKARFNNRKREEGWLTPTARHLLQSHLNLVKRLQKYLPITYVVLELNKFAFMAMDNPNIKRWQYQKGPLYGKENVNDAVYAQQEGHCILCNSKIEFYHHVVPRSKGGSNTLPNIAGLCKRHHDLVHTEDKWIEKLAKKKKGMNKKYHSLSVLNQITPYLVKELSEMVPGNVYVTTGGDTYAFRKDYKLEKTHSTDAYCVACSIITNPSITVKKLNICYDIRQYRKHDRMACHKENIDRKYSLDDVVVAKNRHKRYTQKEDSLEQYRQKLVAKYGEKEAKRIISRLKVEKHSPEYKSKGKWPGGSLFLYNGRVKDKRGYHILDKYDGSDRGTPKCLMDYQEIRYGYKGCALIKKGRGLEFVGIVAN